MAKRQSLQVNGGFPCSFIGQQQYNIPRTSATASSSLLSDSWLNRLYTSLCDLFRAVPLYRCSLSSLNRLNWFISWHCQCLGLHTIEWWDAWRVMNRKKKLDGSGDSLERLRRIILINILNVVSKPLTLYAVTYDWANTSVCASVEWDYQYGPDRFQASNSYLMVGNIYEHMLCNFLQCDLLYLLTVGSEGCYCTWIHSVSHMHSVGLRRTGNRPAPEARTCITYNINKAQTSVLSVGFEPAIPTSERPQTYASDLAATVLCNDID